MMSEYSAVRRTDKIITDSGWIESILKRGQYLTLAMVDQKGFPYLVTTSYGYQDHQIYLHGALEGKKVMTLTHNPQVCFQVVLDTEIVRNELPCKFTWKYRSVVGFGQVVPITSLDEKNKAMTIFLNQYAASHNLFETDPDYLWIARIDITHLSGKHSLYPPDLSAESPITETDQ